MIQFKQVSKYFGDVTAVRDLSLHVEEGELLVLLGTSGCGKTTTLKMVNRLIEPSSGRILVEGEDVMNVDPIRLRREIGYAIQHIGLFPHMTVADNISVVPTLKNWSGAEISRRVDELLDMVGLDPSHFRERYPAQLSGGQKQRIGVARAIAADPDIVLMDEPFGALDPITREQLQEEFLTLQDQLQKTIVFVTHDVFEAVKLADRVALLDAGQLQQLAPPAEIVENPANEFVDRFLGEHRFQLMLLTRSIRPLMGEGSEPGVIPEEAKMPPTATMVEALDVFKKTDVDELPVYEDEEFCGVLRREDVIDAIAEAMSRKAGGERGE
ncbi:MAG: ABC transporter ATP-binding protein [Planctomycetota bacterium]